MISPQCRDPLRLCPCIRSLYLTLMERCREEGIKLLLIETLRALDRQKHYVKIGVSWTLDSFHLPQPPNDLSLAFDVVPKDYLREPLWMPEGPLWKDVCGIGRGLGMFVGAPWPRDKGHYYIRKCRCSDRS